MGVWGRGGGGGGGTRGVRGCFFLFLLVFCFIDSSSEKGGTGRCVVSVLVFFDMPTGIAECRLLNLSNAQLTF